MQQSPAGGHLVLQLTVLLPGTVQVVQHDDHCLHRQGVQYYEHHQDRHDVVWIGVGSRQVCEGGNDGKSDLEENIVRTTLFLFYKNQ